jgi:hypothetical protein
VDKLCARISAFAGKPESVDIGAATSAFTRDVAIEYVLGRKHNSLDREDFNVLMTTVFQDSGHMWRTTKHVRWFGPLIISMPIDWVIKTADEGTKAFLLYVKASCCPFVLSKAVSDNGSHRNLENTRKSDWQQYHLLPQVRQRDAPFSTKSSPPIFHQLRKSIVASSTMWQL